MTNGYLIIESLSHGFPIEKVQLSHLKWKDDVIAGINFWPTELWPDDNAEKAEVLGLTIAFYLEDEELNVELDTGFSVSIKNLMKGVLLAPTACDAEAVTAKEKDQTILGTFGTDPFIAMSALLNSIFAQAGELAVTFDKEHPEKPIKVTLMYREFTIEARMELADGMRFFEVI